LRQEPAKLATGAGFCAYDLMLNRKSGSGQGTNPLRGRGCTRGGGLGGWRR
jgi:hypothetical protein